GEPEIKTKKGLFYFINKTGKFGQLIMYTLLGSVVLLPLGIPSGIVVFIPFFISAFMIMIL
ncbi:MAG: hypothetical protein NE330_04625, partial [Lentisphaeraceae bacterium]|nr:hypothetical protein [Lentisphaeraceae bacterium]